MDLTKIINGKKDGTLNSEEIRYSPQDGWSSSASIEGPKEAVKALLNQLAAQGYSFVYTCDQSPRGMVRFSTSGSNGPGSDETPTLNWEYFANTVEIDVLEADLPGTIEGQTNFNAIADDEKEAIRARIQNPPSDGDNTLGLSTAANDLYSLMLGGLRSVRVDVPSLRVSKLVSGSYPVKASLSNVRRIISTATLEIMEEIPPTLLFELPTAAATKTGYANAWYKKFPNIQTVGGNRWNISQEWEYGLWAKKIYGNAI